VPLKLARDSGNYDQRPKLSDADAPTTALKWHPIVEITPKTGIVPHLMDGTLPWAGLAANTADPILEELLQTFSALPEGLSTVQLKQFRDCQPVPASKPCEHTVYAFEGRRTETAAARVNHCP
jgi:hypothetical protein